MTEPVRVLLADDQPLVRVSLRMVIADAPDLAVVGEAGSGAEAVRLTRELRPDVVVMDIRMPGMDGIEATGHIVAGLPTRVVVLTTFDDDAYVYGALRAGASGFLVKDMALEEILGGIRAVAAGDALIAPGVTRRLIADFVGRTAPAGSVTAPGRDSAAAGAVGAADLPAAVTDREREVLALIAAGRSNTEIAEALAIGVGTVKGYVTRLLVKLDARDRVHLVIAAYRAGVVEPGR